MANLPNYHALALTSATTPALTTSYAVRPVNSANVVVDPGEQGIGRCETAAFYVKCTDTTAGFTGGTVKVQISHDGADATTAAAVNWIDVYCTNVASGAIAIEHTITPGAGLTAWMCLATESTRNAPYARVLGKATGASGGTGDTLDVWVVAS